MGAHRHDTQACGAHPAVQLEDEHGIGQLGLVVCPPRAVAAHALKIVKVDAIGLLVPVAADGDHAAARSLQQRWQEPPGQGEVAQVVGAELPLEALRGGLPFRNGHHAGVVHQQIQAMAAGGEGRGETLHRAEVGQVERDQLGAACRGLGAQPLQRCSAPAGITAASSTWAPARASCTAVWYPSPALAPVTIAVLPD